MLKCREVLGLGSDYIDDGLSTSELWSVRMHLLICPNCRAYIQKLRLTVNTVEELGPLRVSDSEIEHILSRVLPGPH